MSSGTGPTCEAAGGCRRCGCLAGRLRREALGPGSRAGGAPGELAPKRAETPTRWSGPHRWQAGLQHPGVFRVLRLKGRPVGQRLRSARSCGRSQQDWMTSTADPPLVEWFILTIWDRPRWDLPGAYRRCRVRPPPYPATRPAGRRRVVGGGVGRRERRHRRRSGQPGVGPERLGAWRESSVLPSSVAAATATCTRSRARTGSSCWGTSSWTPPRGPRTQGSGGVDAERRRCGVRVGIGDRHGDLSQPWLHPPSGTRSAGGRELPTGHRFPHPQEPVTRGGLAPPR